MASEEDIIVYKPAYTPNQNWTKELDPRHMDSTLSSFKAPKNDKRIITLCKPFVVFSKNSYSSPVTLPLGLAYIGGVLVKADYKVKIIDATGEKRPVRIKRSLDNQYNIQGLSIDEQSLKTYSGIAVECSPPATIIIFGNFFFIFSISVLCPIQC